MTKSVSEASSKTSASDDNILYRIALVRFIDSIFYERGESRWCHIRCHELIVRDIFGTGENTFRSYLHYPHARLDGIEPSQQTKELFRLYVPLIKSLRAGETASFLEGLNRRVRDDLDAMKRRGVQPNAERLLDALRNGR